MEYDFIQREGNKITFNAPTLDGSLGLDAESIFLP